MPRSNVPIKLGIDIRYVYSIMYTDVKSRDPELETITVGITLYSYKHQVREGVYGTLEHVWEVIDNGTLSSHGAEREMDVITMEMSKPTPTDAPSYPRVEEWRIQEKAVHAAQKYRDNHLVRTVQTGSAILQEVWNAFDPEHMEIRFWVQNFETYRESCWIYDGIDLYPAYIEAIEIE